ncbi:hypothetical protein B7494_g5659 [Chlorociboria aeruginascens]|nr:hypothetical protein B7494_g5659 [Chlorociboria aeruginascens]
MCGRYALALRPSQVRAYLEEENMPVYEAPDDEDEQAPRQSYNFAPGYHGLVYRASVPDWGSGPVQHKSQHQNGDEEQIAADPEPELEGSQEVRYRLQTMKWGLIPFWTKLNPDYGSMLKTINCRDDSLAENRGMWNTMKQRKRCIVVAQGFYEWLKKGKEKVPHFVKRRDGRLMCMAGLWDCVVYEGEEEKHYTYTIITTSSNKQLSFLHDRMPVILDNGSDALQTWLDPKRSTWSKDLQALLRPFEGELDVYPVLKDVGKVGNNSPDFIVPVTSNKNKSNIANFFAKGTAKDSKSQSSKTSPVAISTKEDASTTVKHDPTEDQKTVDRDGMNNNAPIPVKKEQSSQGIKRELEEGNDAEEPSKKIAKPPSSLSKPTSTKPARKTRSATSNNSGSPTKSTGKEKGSQKITNFFKK